MSDLYPYNGTSGWSGTDTSRERAEQQDASGVTAKRAAMVLQFLKQQYTDGATWGEVADALGLHHGEASGALSNLHKAGQVARLEERRGRSHVYVLTRNVNGRPTQEPGRNKRTYSEAEVARMVADAYAEGFMAAGGAA